jgi:hypothetical protein
MAVGGKDAVLYLPESLPRAMEAIAAQRFDVLVRVASQSLGYHTIQVLCNSDTNLRCKFVIGMLYGRTKRTPTIRFL